MIGPRPILPVRLRLGVVVLVLPVPARDRYREEFRTELAELGAVSQLAEALSLLAGSFTLRNALNSHELPAGGTTRRAWRCRLGRHHCVGRLSDNPEMRGVGYLRCVRCGKRKDPPSYGPPPPTVIGFSGGAVGAGGY